MPDPAQQGQLIHLEAHPGAPSVAEPPAGQFGLDRFSGDGQAGGQALDDHYQAFAV